MVNLQLLKEVKPDVYGSFIFYAALSLQWLLLKSSLTTFNRVTKSVYTNPEDSYFAKTFAATHPAVERANRMMRNDLENVIPFCMLGVMFCWTTGEMVPAHIAIWVFRTFFISRVLTSVCHYLAIQPFRSLFWLVSFFCNLFLLYQLAMRISQFGLKYA